MEKNDYYETLGVDKNATKKDIKKAYRRLVKKYHPDKNQSPEAEDKFKEVQEAYEVLNDDQKRKAYDQYGHAGTQGFSGFGQSGGYNYGGNYEDLNDILNQFFGGFNNFGGFSGFSGSPFQKQRRKAGIRGSDVEVTLNIDFLEAVFGSEKNIVYQRKIQCDKCKGTGAKEGTSKKTCDTCQGKGVVTNVKNTFIGQIRTQSICPECNGAREIIDEPCEKCNGQGIEQVKEDFKIKIPPGIPDGVVLKFREKGNAGKNGGNSGDLYINIEVSPHEIFERRGDDIYIEQEIDVMTAILGGSIEVPTVHGDIEMKIPAGTQPNKVFKLSERGGIRFKNGGKGDQYVKIVVNIPKNLNKKQKKKLEEFKKI
ncbi:molecular chaperone DnaJ [Candidatus Dojkabacteria bacterium]|nr:molecular chaperone DnaJ [Candidatus Dojkabacteria bacterium]